MFLSPFFFEIQVILCKDGTGKVGIRVKSVNKGIFVCLVAKNTPAAMGGLRCALKLLLFFCICEISCFRPRFGDQILQINNQDVAGFSEDKVHEIFKKCPVNNIVLAVRDR